MYERAKEELLSKIKEGLLEYSVSFRDGMVALSDFDASALMEYSRLCRSKMITIELTRKTAAQNHVEICMMGKEYWRPCSPSMVFTK